MQADRQTNQRVRDRQRVRICFLPVLTHWYMLLELFSHNTGTSSDLQHNNAQ